MLRETSRLQAYSAVRLPLVDEAIRPTEAANAYLPAEGKNVDENIETFT